MEKTLESPLDCKEINQSILKEISPEYSLEGLMLKLKLQYFGHLTQTPDSLEKTLMLGKTEGRRQGCQRICLDGVIDAMDMNLGKFWEMVRHREAWLALCGPQCCEELGTTGRLNNMPNIQNLKCHN